MLPVGAADLGRVGLLDRETAEFQNDPAQERDDDLVRGVANGQGAGGIEYVGARGSKMEEGGDLGGQVPLQHVNEGADSMARVLFFRGDLVRIELGGGALDGGYENRGLFPARLEVGRDEGRLDASAVANPRFFGKPSRKSLKKLAVG